MVTIIKGKQRIIKKMVLANFNLKMDINMQVTFSKVKLLVMENILLAKNRLKDFGIKEHFYINLINKI